MRAYAGAGSIAKSFVGPVADRQAWLAKSQKPKAGSQASS
jgi:hypothetical protein